VAIVERGTFADQRTVSGTLGDIAAIARDAGVRAPAITVVGAVAGLHEELAWFGPGPLAGRSVVVTRARAQASPLAERLRSLGARVVEAPAIRIEPLEATLPDLGAVDLLCVTSPNGARRLFEIARDARALAGPTIAAIGPGTADALRAGGIEADVVPPRAVAESLVETLADRPVARALIARAEVARDVLPDALRERGAEVEILSLYRTVAEPLGEAARAEAQGADYVTFTSASSVHFYVEAAGAPAEGQQIVSIGPITSDALHEHGLEPDIEAQQHTPGGLVAALLADVAPGQLF
jgi:uroporphyrinogen III methyltransferase/synthase